jgi:ABC-type multidrug transport system fused ATPase/permease subunit
MENKKYNTLQNAEYIIKKVLLWDKRICIYFVVYIVTFSLLPLCNIVFPKYIIDGIVAGQSADFFTRLILLFGALLLPLSLVKEYLEANYDAKITFIRFQFLAFYYKKCMRMEYQYTESPEMLDKIEQSCRAVGSSSTGLATFVKNILDGLVNLCSLCLYLGLLIRLKKWVILVLTLNALILYLFQNHAYQYSAEKEHEKAAISRRVSYIRKVMCQESSGKDIRLFDMGEWLCHQQEEGITAYLSLVKSVLFRFKMSGMASALITFFREGLIYMYLVFEVLSGAISIGNFALYVSLFFQFSNMLFELTRNIAGAKGENRLINDFRSFLESDNEGEETVCGGELPIPLQATPEIRLENVSFRYPGTTRDILKNVNLTIPAGQKLAIVGGNGEGKSTLIKLICNLYEPTQGEIYFNGINVKTIPKKLYYQQLAVIFQDTSILEFSIAENITMNKKENSDSKRLTEAIGMGDLERKINALPKKEDTFLGKSIDENGIQLSGGEVQRLMIARAYYKKSGIMILDEPTAALDPIAEKKVYEKYNDMVKNTTSIFISHRLSSTQFCDRVILISGGNIAEDGTHAELLEKQGIYAKLFRAQAKYYL